MVPLHILNSNPLFYVFTYLSTKIYLFRTNWCVRFLINEIHTPMFFIKIQMARGSKRWYALYCMWMASIKMFFALFSKKKGKPCCVRIHLPTRHNNVSASSNIHWIRNGKPNKEKWQKVFFLYVFLLFSFWVQYSYSKHIILK